MKINRLFSVLAVAAAVVAFMPGKGLAQSLGVYYDGHAQLVSGVKIREIDIKVPNWRNPEVTALGSYDLNAAQSAFASVNLGAALVQPWQWTPSVTSYIGVQLKSNLEGHLRGGFVFLVSIR